MPSIKKMYEVYHEKGVEVVSVSLDDNKEAWEKAYKEEIQNRIKEYKSRINTVEDLVKFMFNENVTDIGEYTNYEAQQAAIEKAKELLGIELGE